MLQWCSTKNGFNIDLLKKKKNINCWIYVSYCYYTHIKKVDRIWFSSTTAQPNSRPPEIDWNENWCKRWKIYPKEIDGTKRLEINVFNLNRITCIKLGILLVRVLHNDIQKLAEQGSYWQTNLKFFYLCPMKKLVSLQFLPTFSAMPVEHPPQIHLCLSSLPKKIASLLLI